MLISDWSSDVCSADLQPDRRNGRLADPDRADFLAFDQPDRQAVHRAGQRRGGHPARGSAADDHHLRDATVAHSSHSLSCSAARGRSEEHTSELQSLMRISYAVFCLKQKIIIIVTTFINHIRTSTR